MEKKFIQILKRELEKRCQRNPRYSLRAFSNFLGIDSSSLSSILKGKRSFPAAKIFETADRLGLQEEDRKDFIESLEYEHVSINKVVGKMTSDEDAIDLFDNINYKLWCSGEYSSIYALLAVKQKEKIFVSKDWIAGVLELEEEVVEEVLTDLERLKYVARDENGRARKIGGWIKHSHKAASTQERMDAYKRMMEKLADPSENLPPNCILFRSCFSSDLEKLEQAKKMIIDFNSKLAKFMGEGNNDDVLELTYFIRPLTDFKNRND